MFDLYRPQLIDQSLEISGSQLLIDMPGNIHSLPDPSGVGVYLKFDAENLQARQVFSLGNLVEGLRFTCCHRYEPYWMLASAGVRGGEIPVETQFLMVEQPDHTVTLFIPLLDGAFRCSLNGRGEHGLELVAESGDLGVKSDTVVGLFVASGSDPYSLIESSARSVMQWMGTGRLRAEKSIPDFIDQFGWCTWNAFYQDVTHEKVLEGLHSLNEGGMHPKWVLLDDGWQTDQSFSNNERRLTSFSPNNKFIGDLSDTISMVKEKFGVQTFLVWHAIAGYWAGVNPESFPEYDARLVARSFSPGILHYYPDHNENWWGPNIGVIPDHAIYRFYQDYHRLLRQQGVDGIKVDNQSSLEGVSTGSGGRVAMMQRYHEALEGSAHTHFNGRMINCMSCSIDVLYSVLNSNLTRTSTDFWPDRPETHGLHLYTNAQVSIWFSEFIHPDWDMFQSGHPWGAYHAAARAVSGGPVYVSDKPGEHDFELLRKLVLADGSILRPLLPARPTRDCIFHDPTKEDVLLKIYNLNHGSGVIAAFNARYSPPAADQSHLQGSISPQDVIGLSGEQFVVYAQRSRELRIMAADDHWDMELPTSGWEIFSVVPVENGIAPIGLVEMLNSSGAILEKGFITSNIFRIQARGSGRFEVWSQSAPEDVCLVQQDASRSLPFTYDPKTHILAFTLEQLSNSVVDILCKNQEPRA